MVRWSRKEAIQWRRNQVITYLSLGHSQREVADILKVSKSLVSSDVRYLEELARTGLKSHIEDKLMFEHHKALASLEYIKKRSFEITGQSGDDRIKIAAMGLAKEATREYLQIMTEKQILNKAMTSYISDMRDDMLQQLEEGANRKMINDVDSGQGEGEDDVNAVF